MQRLTIITIVTISVWWFTSSPSTEAIPLPDGSLEYPGYTFSNAENYTLDARVLSREDYQFGREAELSSMDLALGWDRMAETAVVEEIAIRQSGRWYYWQTDSFPISRAEIQSSSANVHIVAQSERVRSELDRVKRGDRLRLIGKLVDIHADDGWRWTSSRSRTDTGNGSCELMLVERIDWL